MRSPGKYLHWWPAIGLVAVALAILARCAHPVAPTGGPQDKTPPTVIATAPPNYSVNFREKKIEIAFDEFIQLKDQAKEVFSSPPMATAPVLTVRGKSLIVQIKEELRDSMTYVISFGSAIVDITESNPLKGFTYVFSTGDVIDSLVIAGQILNASDLKPVENVLFTVYSPFQDTLDPDSMFLKVAPLSATRTRADGSFQLTNLPGGQYLVYGLEDLNNNYYYDLATERIAFLDSLVRPEYIAPQTDTLDSLNTGRLRIIPPGGANHPLTLYLFQEVDSTQRMLSSSISSEGIMQFVFRLPATDLDIMPLNFPGEEDWMISEFSRARDTLTLWPRNMERDTFRLALNLADTLQDTVTLIRKDKDAGRSQRQRQSTERPLEVSLNTTAGYLAPGRDLLMMLREPLVSHDLSGLQIYTTEDTLYPEARIADSIGRRVTILQEWEGGQTYTLYLPDSTLQGLSGAFNDSIRKQIRIKPIEDFGSMNMNYVLSPEGYPCVAELLNEKEAVIRRDTLTGTTLVQYLYLDPGNYRLKVVIDKNGNGRWDTGDLQYKILPERVIFYDKQITVRPNWELQEEWLIGN